MAALSVVIAMSMVTFACLATPALAAEKVVHVFAGGKEPTGSAPRAGLRADAAGALYGVASSGGEHHCGTAFRLNRPAAGSARWTTEVLYSFECRTGTEPESALLMDASGALYGTTRYGGVAGNGTIYRLSQPGAGAATWTHAVLWSFSGYPDGEMPTGDLLADGDGGFFGTTLIGGAGGKGTVYHLIPVGGGAYTLSTLFSFGGSETKSGNPQGGVIAGRGGVLYGTESGYAPSGGIYGTVFALAPPPRAGGRWTYTRLHGFIPNVDGATPTGALLADGDGDLYGTTSRSGCPTCNGTVFKLIPPAAGSIAWTENLLHVFSDKGDGQIPFAGLIRSAGGSLLGTTVRGPGANGLGTVFRLTPLPGGATVWTETVLHAFAGGKDGTFPEAPLARDIGGGLFGTTVGGGDSGCTGYGGCGTVFKVQQ